VIDDISYITSMPIANVNVKVQSITLRHQIVGEIRKAILAGSLLPGERVVERALAAKVGASVTAAREALIQLESEGLITKRSNTTTNITSLTHEEIAQTFAVRRSLERLAVAEAAHRATESSVQHLTGLHDLAVEAATRRHPQLYVQRDFAWHHAIWLASRNDVLANTLRRLVLPLFGFSIIQVVSHPSFDLLEDAQLHAPILHAIARRDATAAVAAFEDGLHAWTTHVREQPAFQIKEHPPCVAAGD